MFATVFPAGPMIVLVSTILRMKIDGWKLCQTVRRPLPKTAEDIGVWCTVIQVLSVISPLYVYGLIFFTSRYLSDTTLANRWIYLILVEFFVICLKYLISAVIDDVPRDVQMQLERYVFSVYLYTIFPSGRKLTHFSPLFLSTDKISWSLKSLIMQKILLKKISKFLLMLMQIFMY